eukprot:Hpha_TRINITY_DN15176_c0_g14::TRINITY_DN15176_c0_g14_i1::g.127786::m.127786
MDVPPPAIPPGGGGLVEAASFGGVEGFMSVAGMMESVGIPLVLPRMLAPGCSLLDTPTPLPNIIDIPAAPAQPPALPPGIFGDTFASLAPAPPPSLGSAQWSLTAPVAGMYEEVDCNAGRSPCAQQNGGEGSPPGGMAAGRLRQRTRQIVVGKNTQEYQLMQDAIVRPGAWPPWFDRPPTPDVYDTCSKRRFDAKVSEWRRALHRCETALAEHRAATPPRLLEEGEEGTPLRQRTRQIVVGKNTQEYQLMQDAIVRPGAWPPWLDRPPTPDVYDTCSKRRFDAKVSEWRRALHRCESALAEHRAATPPRLLEEGEEGSPYPPRRASSATGSPTGAASPSTRRGLEKLRAEMPPPPSPHVSPPEGLCEESSQSGEVVGSAFRSSEAPCVPSSSGGEGQSSSFDSFRTPESLRVASCPCAVLVVHCEEERSGRCNASEPPAVRPPWRTSSRPRALRCERQAESCPCSPCRRSGSGGAVPGAVVFSEPLIEHRWDSPTQPQPPQTEEVVG